MDSVLKPERATGRERALRATGRERALYIQGSLLFVLRI